MKSIKIKALVLVCLGLLFFLVSKFTGEKIELGTRVIMKDSHDVVGVLKRNTPVRFELRDDSWGTATISDPQEVYMIWNILEQLESVEEEPSAIGKLAQGIIYFFDGSSQRFSISNKFELEGFILGNRDEEMEIHNLYEIILHTLYSKENLANLVGQAKKIYVSKAGVVFKGDSPEVVALVEGEQRLLLDYISQSERITDTTLWTEHLLIYGDNPLYSILVQLEGQTNNNVAVISVLSPDLYYVTVLTYLHRNLLFFKGNLINFLEGVYLD